MIFRRAAVLVAVGAVLLSGCSTSRTGGAPPPSTTSTPPSTTALAPASGGGTSGGCAYQADPTSPAPSGKDVGLPTGAEPTTGSVVLRTNQGEIKVALAGNAAPCTVRSFAHLAGKKYFDDSPCHRLTTAESLKVLQCGDPTGSGRGGPGYTIPDENPTDLKDAAGTGGVRTVIYPRGIVAMANTGQPNSGGSQFFLVWADSTLPPTYAVFGTVDAASLAVLDKVAGAGAEASNGPGDGAPKTPVQIQQAVVGV